MKRHYLLLACLLTITLSAFAQKKKAETSTSTPNLFSDTTFAGLTFRSIGPAITSGRIADIAVNPKNTSEYYVAAASGGVWKTVNAGITYEPVFEKEVSYSIGCVTIDPNNTNVVWVVTG